MLVGAVMYIAEITWRHRNDFHFVSLCEHCGDKDRWGDGYADEYYQKQVFPHRQCQLCGLTGYYSDNINKFLWFVS